MSVQRPFKERRKEKKQRPCRDSRSPLIQFLIFTMVSFLFTLSLKCTFKTLLSKWWQQLKCTHLKKIVFINMGSIFLVTLGICLNFWIPGSLQQLTSMCQPHAKTANICSMLLVWDCMFLLISPSCNPVMVGKQISLTCHAKSSERLNCKTLCTFHYISESDISGIGFDHLPPLNFCDTPASEAKLQ